MFLVSFRQIEQDLDFFAIVFNLIYSQRDSGMLLRAIHASPLMNSDLEWE